MKKALVIFFASALVCSAFAAEPAAEVKVAEFKGSAAVTFGVDLDNKTTGFKNETDGSLKLNLMNGGERSTTGDGIWGELKLKIDGLQVKAKHDKNFALVEKKDNDSESDIRVEIATAAIHFGPAYVGIKSGDFTYGTGFWYPHALNYKDSKDEFNRSPSQKLGYDQGIVLGFKNDAIKIEASVRSKKQGKVDAKTILTPVDSSSMSVSGVTYYAMVGGKEVSVEGTGTDTIQALLQTVHGIPGPNPSAYTKKVEDEKPANYWTNKYALGIYGEATPVKDLKVGVGAAYVLGGKDATGDADNKKDFTLFVGSDYRFAVNEDFLVQPTVTYNLYQDFNCVSDKYSIKTNKIGAGLRFGFAKSKESTDSSLLYDFFGEKKLVYETKKNDKGDDILLPGISVYSAFDLKKDVMKKSLPLMVTFYSGELIEGLKAAALFSANVAPEASKGAVYPMGTFVYDGLIGSKGLQAGFAAGYDVKLDGMTIVPAAGFLWTHGAQETGSNSMVADEFAAEAKVDVKGLIANTTLTLFWDNASFGKGESKLFSAKSSVYKETRGLIGLKAKIAF